MTLVKYRQKRDFSITSEPAGASKRSGKHLSFVIQKHAARRLHYDFRLELDGVLKSWAVPKGPSLDPADKRLAVHVEDHPLEYGGFEGVIPEKQYGAGEVIVWDKGSWTPNTHSLAETEAAYRKGHLKFTLDGEKLQGGWALVRMHGRANGDADNWLLIKEDDEFALPGEGEKLVLEQSESVLSGRTVEALKTKAPATKTTKPAARKDIDKKPVLPAAKKTAKLPAMIEPQLATLVDHAPSGSDWAYEVKFDGYRLLARIEKGKARLFTRNGLDWSERFPGIAAALGALPAKQLWLDGEACVMDEKGISRFGALQRYLSGESKLEPLLMLFDLMFIDGQDLRELPLEQRKETLQQLLSTQAEDSPLRYSDHLLASGSDAQAQACQIGLEGLIGKRLDSTYIGRRSRDWIKLKCRQRQEFVIGGYTPPGGSRSNFGSLLLGVYEAPGKLRYAGRIGTGFDARTLQSLHERMQALEMDTSPFIEIPPAQRVRGTRWLKPELVAEVTFAEWTDDGHVRQGAFVGLREDKPAAQIGREVPKPAQATQPSTSPAPPKASNKKSELSRSEAKRSEPIRSEPRRKAASRHASGTEIAGVNITHPERIVYPEAGISKLDIARYYERMAEHLLPYVKDRPLSLVRCPGGTQSSACFFQKHVLENEFPGIETLLIEDSSGKKEPYVIANSVEALAGLAQMNTLELHAWNATAPHLEQPDMFVIDFDPDEGLAWDNVADAARAARALFDGIGLVSFLKTTGGKGLHVVVPIVPEAGWDEVKEFTRLVAMRLVEAFPDRFTASISKARRKGKIFVDYLRNGRGATAIAPYSLRSRPNATVSVPIAWEELDRNIRGNSFTLKSIETELSKRNDPWGNYFDVSQKLTPKMKRSVGM
jgi:bifunctional non-homologous end joining protein LigD